MLIALRTERIEQCGARLLPRPHRETPQALVQRRPRSHSWSRAPPISIPWAHLHGTWHVSFMHAAAAAVVPPAPCCHEGIGSSAFDAGPVRSVEGQLCLQALTKSPRIPWKQGWTNKIITYPRKRLNSTACAYEPPHTYYH